MSEHLELQHLINFSAEDRTVGDAPNLFINKRPLLRRCPYIGLTLATLSALFFSLCSVIVKSLENVDPIQLAMYRFIGVLLPTLPILIYSGEPVWPKDKILMLVLRSFVGATGLMLSFYAFRNMSLGDASVIVFSVPVFVALFARIFLKEPCGLHNFISIGLTLLGVLLITKPPILFKGNVDENKREYLSGAIAAFTSTLFGANAYVLLRALKGLHFSVIMTNFGMFAIIQTFLISWMLGGLCLPQCGYDRVLVLCLGFFSFLGQILLTIALQLEQAGPVAIARSSDIVFAFLWQVLFFNEIPNVQSIIGALLVLSSVLLIGFKKWVVGLPNDSHLRDKLEF